MDSGSLLECLLDASTGRCELAWEDLGIPLEELDEGAGEREVMISLLRLLPQDTTLDMWRKRGGWIVGLGTLLMGLVSESNFCKQRKVFSDFTGFVLCLSVVG